jgi:adenylylsulfate kinase-like enzyme
MVIFVAGLVGTGKTSLSNELSKELKIFHYDVDEIKKIVYRTDSDYEYNIANGVPFSIETRMKTFRRAVEDFPQLAKEHEHIIVEEVMNRRDLRQIFYDGANKYFGGYIQIWIKSDEAVVRERLSKGREGHMLKEPFTLYLALKKSYEDFENPDIVFENNGPFEESVHELIKLVKEKLAQHGRKI